MIRELAARLFADRAGRLTALLAALCVPVALGAAYFADSPGVIHRTLLWNLFLAAIPLGLSRLIARREQTGRHRGPTLLLLALWLAFYPNAPYMLTDLVHLDEHLYWASGAGFLPDPYAWLGLLHIVTGVMVGCGCGVLSLHLLHERFAARFGRGAGWGFALLVSLLGGVGIYLGRFLRFNTWDLVRRPGAVAARFLGSLGADALTLCLTFTAMILLPYLLFRTCFAGEAGKASEAPAGQSQPAGGGGGA